MKLTAYRDRRDDRDKDLGRHHALDVFRVVAMLTESERDEVQTQLREYSANPQVESCARLVRAGFLASNTSAVLAMREHPLWNNDDQLAMCFEVLSEMFP